VRCTWHTNAHQASRVQARARATKVMRASTVAPHVWSDRTFECGSAHLNPWWTCHVWLPQVYLRPWWPHQCFHSS
jgi:hypothetical protein